MPQKPPCKGPKKGNRGNWYGSCLPSLPRTRYLIDGDRVRWMGAPVTLLERFRSQGTPRPRHTCPASASGMRRRPGGPRRRAVPGAPRRPRICPALPAVLPLRRGGPTCNPDRPKPRGGRTTALCCGFAGALRAENSR